MNRNRHLSRKPNQKRVRSGVNVNPNFKVVTYPTLTKHEKGRSAILYNAPTKGYRPQLGHSLEDWMNRKAAKKAASV